MAEWYRFLLMVDNEPTCATGFPLYLLLPESRKRLENSHADAAQLRITEFGISRVIILARIIRGRIHQLDRP